MNLLWFCKVKIARHKTAFLHQEVYVMNEVVKFLQENPVQYLATVGRDGKAKCRPFMFSGEMDGKLWFCTNNLKAPIHTEASFTPL